MLLLGGLVHDLVLCLLELVVLVVEHLLEAEGLLRVAVSLECVKDLGKLSLADDGVLELADSLVGEDHMALVNSKFEGQEENRDVDGLVLSHLDHLKLAGVRVRHDRLLLLPRLPLSPSGCGLEAVQPPFSASWASGSSRRRSRH